MKYVYLGLNWVFGVLFLLAGLVALIENPLGSICLIGIAALLLPPIRSFVYAKIHKEFPVKARAITMFVLLLAFGVFVGQARVRKLQELEAQEAKQKAEKATQMRQEKIDYFNANRDQIISSLKYSLSEKEYQAVITQSEEYIFADDEELVQINLEAKNELAAIQKAERTKKFLDELKYLPADSINKNKYLYQQLVNMHPDNEYYKKKLSFYMTKIAEQEDKAKLEVERKKKIERQFSAWDGSHKGLERLIKKTMNDPDSYDHVETIYWDKGQYLVVKTTFRGKNAFGGVVVNWIKAKSDMDGNVIEIMESYP